MYVGRIVSIGMTKAGRLAAMYRVSSRSFPNREAKILDKAISILPKAGFEDDIHKNPYIAYNCLRLTGPYAVATNGSHTDPITEKLDAGMNMRDALVAALFGMDYEHDSLNTPRIASIVQKGTGKGYLGIVRHDALLVSEYTLEPGQAYYICTYEHNVTCPNYVDKEFDVDSAAAACQYVLGQGVFADLERPITAACALETDDGFETAVADMPQN
jgi:IMP cyclohydrolase